MTVIDAVTPGIKVDPFELRYLVIRGEAEAATLVLDFEISEQRNLCSRYHLSILKGRLTSPRYPHQDIPILATQRLRPRIGRHSPPGTPVSDPVVFEERPPAPTSELSAFPFVGPRL